MYTINIPGNSNEYDYVLSILNLLNNGFREYTFINCTESPLDEFEYIEYNGIYYRELGTLETNKNKRCQVNEQDYMNSYEGDHLKEDGFTLKEYIDMCFLFELDRIEIIPKCQGDQFQPGNIDSDHVATILICPDGWNEIQIHANEEVLSKLIAPLSKN